MVPLVIVLHTLFHGIILSQVIEEYAPVISHHQSKSLLITKSLELKWSHEKYSCTSITGCVVLFAWSHLWNRSNSTSVWSLVQACVAIVTSLTGEMAVQRFGYHTHGTADSDKSCCYAWFVCHDKTLNQQCLACSGSPPDDKSSY